MAVGLKGSWKELKGCSFRYRIKQLKWNLRYAWQRAWRGWDDVEVFNMDVSFIEKYKEILKYYRINHHCLFNVPEEYRDIFNKWHFNDVETNVIIDTMIFHLEMMNEDHVEKMLYGKNVYDDDYDPKDYNIDKCKHISSIVDQNKNTFMELFNTFFWDLWD